MAVGIAASAALRSILASQLFGVSPADPPTVIAVAAVLIVVAMTASIVPALRAGRIDPVAALRS
jgi:ABC-type lipoprotein release transport system permease subunit